MGENRGAENLEANVAGRPACRKTDENIGLAIIFNMMYCYTGLLMFDAFFWWPCLLLDNIQDGARES